MELHIETVENLRLWS